MSPSRAQRGLRPPGCVLPRPGRPDRSRADGSDTNGDRGGPRSQARRTTDADALALREEGRSYAAVARNLGLKRATDARQAFLRGMRARPDEERRLIADRERGRLDKLELRIRERDADDPVKLERRLTALAQLRLGLD